jgi:hypothetical protein
MPWRNTAGPVFSTVTRAAEEANGSGARRGAMVAGPSSGGGAGAGSGVGAG